MKNSRICLSIILIGMIVLTPLHARDRHRHIKISEGRLNSALAIGTGIAILNALTQPKIEQTTVYTMPYVQTQVITTQTIPSQYVTTITIPTYFPNQYVVHEMHSIPPPRPPRVIYYPTFRHDFQHHQNKHHHHRPQPQHYPHKKLGVKHRH